VIQTGSVAVMAYVFGDYASELARLGPYSSAVYAALAVVAITGVQWVGVRASVRMQNALTVAEVLGLLAVIVAGLLIAPGATSAAAAPSTPAYGLIMVFVLLTFGGWNEAVYVSAELKDARRRMAPVLIGSLVLITVLYVLANAAYLRVLGLGGTAGSDAVAADLMRIAFGPAGAVLISAFVAIAALTSANATVFTGARTAYALGRDHPQLAALGRWSGTAETPRNGVLLQGAAALGVVLIGALTREGFETAVQYTAAAFWFFFLLVGISLFVLRWKEPDAERPFRVPLYPLTPALFCLTNAYLLWSSITYAASQELNPGAIAGLVVLAVGLVLLIPLRTPRKETTS
jgi:basic amino acid/polyamine antiporter, APA family